MTFIANFAATSGLLGDGRFALLIAATSLLAVTAVVVLSRRGLRRIAANTTSEFNERLRDEVAIWAAGHLDGDLEIAKEQYESAFRLNDWAELAAPWDAVSGVRYRVSRDGSNSVVCDVSLIAKTPKAPNVIEASIRFRLPWSEIPEQLRRTMLTGNTPLEFELLSGPNQQTTVSPSGTIS